MSGYPKKSFVFSLALAVLSGLSFFLYLEADGKGSVEDVRKVTVALKDISEGEKITSAMLAVREVASSGIPSQAFSNPKQVVNKKAAASIYKGEVVVSKRLETNATKTGVSELIGKQKLAIAIQADAFSSLEAGIRPDDHVDVLAVEPDGLRKESRVVCRNIRVVGMQDDDTLGKKDSLLAARSLFFGGKTIVLEVTEAEAKKITFAAETAKLKFALHSNKGVSM